MKNRCLSVNFCTLSHLSSALVLLLVLLMNARVTSAAVYGGGGLLGGLSIAGGISGISPATNITTLILNIITVILDVILLLAILAIIIAGIYLITSGGDDTQKEKAKKIIIYALIGIAVVLLSRAIVIFVNHLF